MTEEDEHFETDIAFFVFRHTVKAEVDEQQAKRSTMVILDDVEHEYLHTTPRQPPPFVHELGE